MTRNIESAPVEEQENSQPLPSIVELLGMEEDIEVEFPRNDSLAEAADLD